MKTKTTFIKVGTLFIALLLMPFNVFSQSGTLDTTFDTDGIVRTSFSTGDNANSVAIQTDGKIVVAGVMSNPTNLDFAVARYNINGGLDTTFDTDGKVTTSIGSSDDIGYSVAIQTDGKIVVAGASRNSNISVDFAVVRYNANGSLDTSFGTNGKVTTDIGGDDFANSVAIQADGKVVVAGFSGNQRVFSVVRYNANGSLDTTFDTDGKIMTSIGNENDKGLSVAIQTNGKIVVVGSSSSQSIDRIALVRYNTDGSLDTTLNTDGIVVLNSDKIGYSVAIQTDGKIVIATFGGVVRCNPDGSFDNTFGVNGVAMISTTTNFIFRSIAIQTDEKIVVAGYQSNSEFFATGRFNSNGSNDTTFGTNGVVTTGQIVFGSHEANSVAIQSDGKIVVAGTVHSSTDSDFAVVRYNNIAIPVANFTANVTTISVGDSVNFTDLSTNEPTSWNWIFNGAATTSSTVQNPTNITYNTVGCYAVSLTATNSAGNNTATQTCYINVSNAPAGCNELFFSEYLEGTSNSKALEIYNPSNNAIDLSSYSVVLYANGGTTATNTQVLSGSIAAHSTYVLANAASVAGILSLTNLTSNVCSFNGDDAVVLKNGTTIIDVIGEVGVDPGLSWVVGSGSTVDYTLVRNANVDKPSNSWTTVQNQWTANPVNTITNLGQHTSNCNTLSIINNNDKYVFKLYPNPANNYFEISTNSEVIIDKVEVFSMLGQLVKTYSKQILYDTTELTKGTYVIKINSGNVIENKKLVVE